MGSSAIRTRICSPNTLFTFVFFSKKGSLESLKSVNFGVTVHQKSDFCVKNCVPTTASKKGAPPESNNTLSVGQEAPGEAASRAHCTDKKQLFEQQLKHRSRFLQKKVDRAQNLCEKLTGLLNRCKKAGLLKNVVS